MSVNSTELKEGFSPLIATGARILILGTMPGDESLRLKEYYANPRNQFWRIMQALYDIPQEAPYATRVAALMQNQIGLWDVLHSAERNGSLDSAIKNRVPNDFTALFAAHNDLKLIAFNSKKAAQWFNRCVAVQPVGVKMLTLVSSSPAAAMSFEKKLASWAALKNY
jgi:TDG/mug DNA glycosylase family protein